MIVRTVIKDQKGVKFAFACILVALKLFLWVKGYFSAVLQNL